MFFEIFGEFQFGIVNRTAGPMGMFSDLEADRRPGGTLAFDVLERLRDDILCCRLAPGAKLPYQDLKERYRVNFGPLREALMQLASEGLVEMAAQRGCRVAPISVADLLDTTRTRSFVERELLRQSIRDGDVEWEARLLAAFRRLEAIETALDGTPPPPKWDLLHRDFHHALTAGCGSVLLHGIAARLFDRARRYRMLSVALPDMLRGKAGEHRALMQAALARDTGLALDLLDAHLQDTATRALDAMQRLQPAG